MCYTIINYVMKGIFIMNDTLKTIYERYSCRAFTDKPLTQEQISEIVKSAIASPSGMNGQPWQIIVVDNKELIEEMDAVGLKSLDKSAVERIMQRGGKLFYNATCFVVIAIKPGTQLDCGIVCENIALAASAMGLGNVICGLARGIFTGESGAKYKELLKFPEGYEFGMSILIGNAEVTKPPHELDYNKITYIK